MFTKTYSGQRLVNHTRDTRHTREALNALYALYACLPVGRVPMFARAQSSKRGGVVPHGKILHAMELLGTKVAPAIKKYTAEKNIVPRP